MTNITAPRDAETIAFEPSRSKETLADMNADAAFEAALVFVYARQRDSHGRAGGNAQGT